LAENSGKYDEIVRTKRLVAGQPKTNGSVDP
jgi:hypothetical protein